MALNISLLLMPWPIFLAALILIIVAIIFLSVIERRLHKKVIIKKEEEDTYFLRKLETARNLKEDSGKFLSAIDALAREFFEDESETNDARYSVLIEKLDKKGDKKGAKFCEEMQEALYSGEEVSKEKLDLLFEKLSCIIKEREKTVKIKNEPSPVQPMPTVQTVQPVKVGVVKQLPKREISAEIIAVKEIEKKEVIEKPTEININILKYLNEGMKRGFEVSSLKEKLLGGGFAKREIDRVIAYLAIKTKEQEKIQTKPEQTRQKQQVFAKPLPDENAGRKILIDFFRTRDNELDVIKKEVEDYEPAKTAKTELMIVPYKKQVIETRKKDYPKREPKSYQYHWEHG